jgi:hypothetical protein
MIVIEIFVTVLIMAILVIVADVGLKIAGAAICRTRSNIMTKTKNDITPIFQALSLGFIAGMLFAISLYAWADYIFGRGVH